MDTLPVDICYRPLRLGWAIHRGDIDSLRRIFRFSHTLWGGCFNPVIVVDNADQAKRLVELFRVDFIWPFANNPAVSAFPDRFPHLINPFLLKSLIVGNTQKDKRAQLLDIHNALVSMSADEIRALRGRGFRIYSWESDDPLADLFLIQAGAYPDAGETGIDYKAIATLFLQPQEVALARGAPLSADMLEHPTLSYLPSHRMRRHYTTPAGWDHPGFYVGNIADFDDLVTYWNLRAAGIRLSFVDPGHSSRFTEYIPAWEKSAQELLARAPEPRRRLAVWSRSDGHQTVLQLFGGRQHTFCRVHNDLWDGCAVSAPMMYFGEAQVLGTISRSATQPRVSFPLAHKPFAGHRWFHTQHLAASVSFGGGLFGDDEFTLNPPYVPELNGFLATHMYVQYDRLRVEPERLAMIVGAADTDASVSALPVSELFNQIFDLAGFNATPSNSGLIARQLITRLGGLQGAMVFKIPGVRRLLKQYGPNASFSKKGALQLIGQTDRFAEDERLFIEARPTNNPLKPRDVFTYLVAKGLFRIGADLTCPTCRLTSWVALDNLQHRIVCSLCGSVFDATRQLIDKQWAYRRSGLLGLEKNIQGAVPVVLTLQQLDANDVMSKRLYTPSLDLSPKDGTPPLEVDFVWLVCREGQRRTALLIGECKDEQDEAIDENDIETLRRVADALPRSRFKTFIVLAKLVPFSEREIALARTLNGEHDPRVIMLTRRELEPYFFLERTKIEFPYIHQCATSPEDLALVTAQIYFRQA